MEVDDTWIGAEQAGLRGSRQLKDRKAALVVAAVEKRGKGSGRIRMEVIHDFTSATINDFVAGMLFQGLRYMRTGWEASLASIPMEGIRANKSGH